MMKLILALMLGLLTATAVQAQPATQIYTGTPVHPVASSNPLMVTIIGTMPLATGAATAANQTNGSQVTQVTGALPAGTNTIGAVTSPTTTYQGTLALTAATSTALTSGNVTMAPNSAALPAAGSFLKLVVIVSGTNPVYVCWFGGTCSATSGSELLAVGAIDAPNLAGSANAPSFFSTAGSTVSFRN
jgi:hypothetical protein